MAHQVVNTIDEILKYDKEKVIRPNYGETSLRDFEKEYDNMLNRLNFIKQYSTFVDNNTNNQVNSYLQNFKGQISSLVNYDQSQYVANKLSITQNLRQYFDSLKSLWPHYACAAIEDIGLLSNSNLQKEFKDISESLKKTTDETLEKINKESKEIIKQATEKANEIENSVRKTAQKISVQEAQTQFDEAANYHLKQSKFWGSIIGGLVIIFIGFVCYLLNVNLPDKWTWQILYYTAIRLSIITLISSLLAFSFKILKSHLHLQQHNLHRKRIANSMSAFVESANTKEQRDSILSQLVSSVSTFGTTGIFENDSDSSAKISVDTITKTVETVKGEK